MEWIKNLKINQKMHVIIAISALFFVLLGLIGFYYSSTAAKSLQTMYEDRLLPVQQIGQMRANANANLSDLQSLMLESNPQLQKKYVATIKERTTQNEDLTKAYDATNQSSEVKVVVEKMVDSRGASRTARAKVRDLALAGKRDAAWVVYRSQAVPATEEYFAYLGEIYDLNAKNAEEMHAKGNKDSQTANLMLIVSIVGGVILLVSLGIMISNMITRPIKQAIDGLNFGTEEVSSAASQVAAASQSLAEGASEQAAAIQETSATLEETSSMVHQNRENTQQAAVLAKQAKQYAEKSNDEMYKMSQSMSELKNSSSEIAKIIKVIDEIAFQTNILSLNAAVEAARAGDAGKGFAVVAEEVRSLAQRSAQAAKDTTIIIESNIDLSDSSVNIAKAVRESVESIGEQATKVSDLLDEISVATNEQAQGVEQIHKAVSQMEIALQSNAATADESASASSSLQEQAINVKDIVDSLIVLVDGAESLRNQPQRKISHSATPSIPAKRTIVSVAKSYSPSIATNKNNGVLIEWNQGFSVGVTEMDNQHKQLVNLLNDLYSAMQSKKSSEIIGNVLNKLISYTKTHFTSEEEFMKKHSYPGLANQIKEHAAFVDKALKFKSDYDAGKTSMSVSITSFLKDWLVNHISVSDKKYGAHVNNRGTVNPELVIPLGDF